MLLQPTKPHCTAASSALRRHHLLDDRKLRAATSARRTRAEERARKSAAVSTARCALGDRKLGSTGSAGSASDRSSALPPWGPATHPLQLNGALQQRRPANGGVTSPSPLAHGLNGLHRRPPCSSDQAEWLKTVRARETHALPGELIPTRCERRPLSCRRVRPARISRQWLRVLCASCAAPEWLNKRRAVIVAAWLIWIRQAGVLAYGAASRESPSTRPRTDEKKAFVSALLHTILRRPARFTGASHAMYRLEMRSPSTIAKSSTARALTQESSSPRHSLLFAAILGPWRFAAPSPL